MATYQDVKETDKNLVIDIMNAKTLISDDVLKSNEVYANGYLPYAIRRRMDLCEGEEYEIVNDISVNLECAHLRNYNNRNCASRKHIHDLLEYAFSKGTLITPAIDFDPDSIIREGEIYNQARMAWECIKYYIHTIITKKVNYSNPDRVQENINSYIFWDDFINFVMTTLKLKHDPEIAEIMAHLFYSVNKSFFSKQITERVVTYIMVGSRPGELEEKYVNYLHKMFPEYISRLAAGFFPQEIGLVDTTLLPTEDITKYGYQMVIHDHQVLIHNGYPRFGKQIEVANFFTRILADAPSSLSQEYKRQYFASFLVNQIGIKNYIPQTIMEIPTTPEEAEKFVTRNMPEYRFVTFALWIQFHYEELERFAKPNLMLVKSPIICNAVATALVRLINEHTTLGGNSHASSILHDITPILINRAIEEIKNSGIENPITQVNVLGFKVPCLKPFMAAAQNHMASESIAKLFEHKELLGYAIETVHVYNKAAYAKKYMPMGLRDETLKKCVDAGVPINRVLKVTSGYDLEFLKENYGKLFVEVTDDVVRNSWYHLSDEALDWIVSVLTEEQMKSYPFAENVMRRRPEVFKKYIDECNIDRYISAYGLNWVEEHHGVSVSDIVNSNSYVNAQVVRRYLDVILLDDDLRKKFLMNPAVAGIPILDDVMYADNFSNAIKCEVLMYRLINARCEVKNVEKYVLDILPGSGLAGRALLGAIHRYGKTDKYDKYFHNTVIDVIPKLN